MMKKTIMVLILGAVLRSPVHAYWFGNPAEPIKKDGIAAELVYDFGGRDVRDVSRAGGTIDLDSRRFFVQMRRGMSDEFQLQGRLVPGTARVDVGNGSFNPHIWGGGVALRFSPPESIGPVRLGIVGSWDWNYGTQPRPAPSAGHDSINWVEGSVAAGASVELREVFSVYGGGSLVKPDIHVDVAGVETNFEADSEVGGFLGLSAKPSDYWSFSIEKHLGNEETLGFTAIYFF